MVYGELHGGIQGMSSVTLEEMKTPQHRFNHGVDDGAGDHDADETTVVM